MKNFALAVKALIIKNDKVLILKRKPDNPHAPDKQDIPGGRLEIGEDPFEGLRRECLEETKCDIEIGKPLDVQHFKRTDDQIITMIVFDCQLKPNQEIQISDEHSEYRWSRVEETKRLIPWLTTI